MSKRLNPSAQFWNPADLSGMHSLTLSQLRSTRRLIAWLSAGETIELRMRKRVIGHIIPVCPWPFPKEEGPEKFDGKREPGRPIGPTGA
jgi:hypothetical protein